MRQLVISSPGVVELRDAETPEPGPGEVQVLTTVVGICGSDLHALAGTHPFITLPCVPGHEVAGVVGETGPGVTGLKAGMRVILEPNLTCGQCPYCRSGRYNICERLRVVGCQAPGAMADAFTAPASRFHVIPDRLSDAQAALVEPLSTAVHAVRMAGPLAGAAVAVLGGGTIGLLTLTAAVRAGAGQWPCQNPGTASGSGPCGSAPRSASTRSRLTRCRRSATRWAGMPTLPSIASPRRLPCAGHPAGRERRHSHGGRRGGQRCHHSAANHPGPGNPARWHRRELSVPPPAPGRPIVDATIGPGCACAAPRTHNPGGARRCRGASRPTPAPEACRQAGPDADTGESADSRPGDQAGTTQRRRLTPIPATPARGKPNRSSDSPFRTRLPLPSNSTIVITRRRRRQNQSPRSVNTGLPSLKSGAPRPRHQRTGTGCSARSERHGASMRPHSYTGTTCSMQNANSTGVSAGNPR